MRWNTHVSDVHSAQTQILWNTGSRRGPELRVLWRTAEPLSRAAFTDRPEFRTNLLDHISYQTNNPAKGLGKAKRGGGSDLESRANIPGWCLSNLIKVLVRCCTRRGRFHPAHPPNPRGQLISVGVTPP